MQPGYEYDLFSHSGASSLFPSDDGNFDRSNSAPPIQGLQRGAHDMKIPSDHHLQSQYDPGQAWQLWNNDSSDHGKPITYFGNP